MCRKSFDRFFKFLWFGLGVTANGANGATAGATPAAIGATIDATPATIGATIGATPVIAETATDGAVTQDPIVTAAALFVALLDKRRHAG